MTATGLQGGVATYSDAGVIAVVAALSLLVRHQLGFGFSMAFVPALSFFLPFGDTVELAISYELLLGLVFACQWRRHMAFREVAALSAWACAGAGLGVFVAPHVPANWLAGVGMGSVLATVVVLLWGRFPVPHNRRALFAAGFASGVLNAWSSMSGPPVVLYFYGATRADESARAGLAGYFAVLYAFTFALYALGGLVARQGGRLLVGWAVVLVGALLVYRIAPALKGQALRRVALALLGVVALVSLTRLWLH